MKNYKELQYIHQTLQEVIKQSKNMGDHLIDLNQVEKALGFIEDMFDWKHEMQPIKCPDKLEPDHLPKTSIDILQKKYGKTKKTQKEKL